MGDYIQALNLKNLRILAIESDPIDNKSFKTMMRLQFPL